MRRSRYADLDAAVHQPRTDQAPSTYGGAEDMGFEDTHEANRARGRPLPADDGDDDAGDAYRIATYEGGYPESPRAVADDEEARYDGEDDAEEGYLPVEEEGDEEAPSAGRARPGLLTVATVLGLAILGTAGAFGYRAWSGSNPATPPIIKASPEPAKVLATSQTDGQPSKQIYDRVDRPQGPAEQVVTREEEPVNITTQSTVTRGLAGSGPTQGGFAPSPPGPGVMQPAPLTGGTPTASEPRKVHTITIRPDLSPGVAPAAAEPGGPAHGATLTPTLPSTAASSGTPAASAPPPPRGQPSSRKVSQPPSTGALAIAPQGTEPGDASTHGTAFATAQPTRNAALPNASEPGHYVVQVSAQRSETDAEASFRSLQAKYPSVLGGRQPLINRADKGDKGIFYRAQVGPFATVDEANQLCNSLKAAGGQCFVYRM